MNAYFNLKDAFVDADTGRAKSCREEISFVV